MHKLGLLLRSIDTNSNLLTTCSFLLVAVASLSISRNPLWSRRLSGLLSSDCGTNTLVRKEAWTGYGNRSFRLGTRWIRSGTLDTVFDRTNRGAVGPAGPGSVQSRCMVG